MDPNEDLVPGYPYFIQVYKDGHVERLVGTDTIPPSIDSKTGVSSKDVVLVPQTGLSARIYIPKINTASAQQKFPLMIYFHGGGFYIENAFSPTYHTHLNLLVSVANIVVVSVDYRLAPEHKLPIAYNDSWDALKWVDNISMGKTHEPWLNDHADFARSFLSGDSAGANIAHNMGIRLGMPGHEKLYGINVIGAVLVHPYFWGEEPIGSEKDKHLSKRYLVHELWLPICPSKELGCDDPLINPAKDTNLSHLGFERVLVLVVERDIFKDRGFYYCELLRKCGWKGVVEVNEMKGENHVFHLVDHTKESSMKMITEIASFVNQKVKCRAKASL